MYFNLGDQVRVTDTTPPREVMKTRGYVWMNEYNEHLGKTGTVRDVRGDGSLIVRIGTIEIIVYEDFVSFEAALSVVKFWPGERVVLRKDRGLSSEFAGVAGTIKEAAAGSYKVETAAGTTSINESYFYPQFAKLDQYLSGDFVVLADNPLNPENLRGKRLPVFNSQDHSIGVVLPQNRTHYVYRTDAAIAKHEPQAVRQGVRVRVRGTHNGESNWAIGRAGVIRSVGYDRGKLYATVRVSNRNVGHRPRDLPCFFDQLEAMSFLVRDRVFMRSTQTVCIVTAVAGDSVTLETGETVPSRELDFSSGQLPGPSVDPDNTCDCCDEPLDQCECFNCRNCDTTCGYSEYCSGCSHCHDCCSCENDDEEDNRVVEFVTHELVEADFKRPGRKDHKKNPTSRLIACELEVARVTRNHGRGCATLSKCVNANRHSVVTDGSLPEEGFEINTCPAGGDHFVNGIEELCGVLDHYGARVNSSCGYHVHVDARDFTYWDMRRLVRFYAKVEKALFACVAPSRRNSHYAKPCGKDYLFALTRKGDGFRHGLSETLYGIDMAPPAKGNHDEHSRDRRRSRRSSPESVFAKLNPSLGPVPTKPGEASPMFIKSSVLHDYKSEKYATCRYNAMNLHSWYYRGTVEYRLHHGTVNAKKVINWGLLWAGILDYSMRTPESTIIEMAKDISVKPVDALLKAAPTTDVRDWVLDRIETFGTSAMAHDEEMATA